MKQPCSRCFKRRPCKVVTGPGLDPAGESLCRPCKQAVMLAAWLKVPQNEREIPISTSPNISPLSIFANPQGRDFAPESGT